MVQLHLPGYEGPLRLLLELIERRELDINELSLVEVTDQYLDRLEHLKAQAGDELAQALAEFVDIGARLMLLKSRTLLPRVVESTDEASVDVGQELVEMLEDYRRYRDAVGVLEERDRSGERAFRPIAAPAVERPTYVGLPETVTLDVLTRLVREALGRAEERERTEEQVALQRESFTVRAKILDLRGRLRGGAPLSFSRWIAEAESRLEVIVTFLAILELYKSQAIELGQDATYGDILIEPRAQATEEAWLPPGGPEAEEADREGVGSTSPAPGVAE